MVAFCKLKQSNDKEKRQLTVCTEQAGTEGSPQGIPPPAWVYRITVLVSPHPISSSVPCKCEALVRVSRLGFFSLGMLLLTSVQDRCWTQTTHTQNSCNNHIPVRKDSSSGADGDKIHFVITLNKSARAPSRRTGRSVSYNVHVQEVAGLQKTPDTDSIG